MTQTVNSVVIMNMHYSGLGIARALAHSGARLIGLSFDDTFFGNHSRHIEFRQFPNPQFNAQKCARYLVELSAELGARPLLLPTRDIDVLFVMQFRQTLDDHFTIQYPRNEVLNNIIQKDRLYQSAQQIGVACPHDVSITNVQALQNAISLLTFPVIAKPVVAADWRDPNVWRKVGGQKVRRFGDAEELTAFYERIVDLAPRLSLQNYIEGPDSDLRIIGCYRSRSGAFSYFSLQKLLQYPKEAGTGIVLETCHEVELAASCEELLCELGYHGIAEIEFKLDRSSNKYVLIEINTRHWDQHNLGNSVGINLSQHMLDDANGLPPSQSTPNHEAVKWIADDQYLANLMRSMTRSEYNVGYTLQCIRGKKTFAVFSTKDLKPFFFLSTGTLRSLLTRAAQKLAKMITGKRRSDT